MFVQCYKQVCGILITKRWQNVRIASAQVLKHGVLVALNGFTFSYERLERQEWLDWHHRLRNDGCDPMGGTARISEINNYEAREVSQYAYCSRQVSALWFLKIE